MNAFLTLLQQNEITADIVEQMIEEHQKPRERMWDLYQRYKGETDGVPILTRLPVDYKENFETGMVKRIDNKVNNRLNTPFDANIVDTKVGYLFGFPISYTVEENETFQEFINEFNRINNMPDMDSEWGKKAAICGYGARLAYVNQDGDPDVRNVNPWEVAIISEEDISEPVYALRYFKRYDWKNGTKIEKRVAHFYDSTYRYTFEGEGTAKLAFVDRQEHLFDHCPLYGLPNNEEQKGDAEKVMALIDAYDRTLSDASNEIEQYRMAYLVLRGLGADEDTLERLKQSGVFELFDKDDSVDYLTKDINDALIEHHLDRLEDSIIHQAKSVNFSDEQFAGAASGVAMKYKLLALENKSIGMERKMTAALRYQYKVLCSAWEKKNIASADDYKNLEMTFTRNLPVNLPEEAQVQRDLKGLISEETRLMLFSQITDVQWELDTMKEEEEQITANLPRIGGAANESGNNRQLPGAQAAEEE